MNYSTNYIAFQTIFIKEARRFLRIWPQTLLPSAITMVLYFVIFGNLIGSRIGKMDGYDYMQFLVPGLIMMSVITNSYGNVVASFFSIKFQRSIEELLVSPVPNYIILLGFVFGGMIRGILCGAIVTLLSLFFTNLPIDNIGLTILVMILTSALFSLAGFINAIFATKFDDISIIPTFILTPLTYLGGVFYSIKLLPEFWQTVSMANPILYMVSAFRHGILGVSDVNIFLAMAMICFFVMMFFIFSLFLLNKGIGIRQ